MCPSSLIIQKKQYVVTQSDHPVKGDLELLLNVFDSYLDGKSDASDAKFSLFKLIVTNADGSVITVRLLCRSSVTDSIDGAML